MVKRILGALAGIIICGLVIFAIEWLGSRFFPGATEAAAAGDLSRVPLGALITVLVGWFVGPLVGGYVAVRIADRGWVAWIVAGFVVLGVVLNTTMIPHPLWMVVLGLLLPLLAGWIASRGRPTVTADAA